MTFGEDGLADCAPTAPVSECCSMGEEGDWLPLLGDLKFLCNCMLGWSSRQNVSPSRVVMDCCTKRVWSYSGTKLQHDVTGVMLRLRQQNWALSAEIVDERADGSPELELGNWGALTHNGVLGGILWRRV